MEAWREELYRDELYHHGVLGMKWGVRRYQNYDGTLTQRGLKTYRDEQAKYDAAKEKRKAARRDFKNSSEYLNSDSYTKKRLKSEFNYKDRENLREERHYKKTSKEAYKHLRDDKLADEGKKMYSSGRRIIDSYSSLGRKRVGAYIAGNILAKALWESGAKAHTRRGTIEVGRLLGAGLAGGSAAYMVGSTAKTMHDNRRMRAYYGHSSYKPKAYKPRG